MTVTAEPTTTSRNSHRQPRGQQRTPSRLVVGTVQRFRHDKGFGFASIDGEQGEVFLHNGFGREVVGTPEQPKLTRTETKVEVSDASTDNPSRVIMLIVPGKQGLRAIAWGLIPTGNWHDCLFSTLKEYVGGMIVTGRVNGNTFAGLEFSGTLVMASVDNGILEITMGDTKQRNRRGNYLPLSNPYMKLTYDVTSATDGNGQMRDSFAIRFPDGDEERQLTFSLPKQN